MRILHYSLGFPPYRSGGLVKFCMDLMKVQKEQGHVVGLVWPGEIKLLEDTVKIKRRKDIEGISSFELINPLPVPLDEGIWEVEKFMKQANLAQIRAFLLDYKPDTVHIHTLMGLHKEIVKLLNELKIRTVFTTHDYFGICPKVHMYKKGCACMETDSFKACVYCNYNALSIKKIYLMQSRVYRLLKDSSIIKYMRRQHRKKFFDENEQEQYLPEELVTHRKKAFKNLSDYYKEMLENIDIIHFNSTVTQEIYEKYITYKAGQVISITHADITDERQIKDFSHEKFQLAYLGPAKPYKGYFILKAALDELYAAGDRNFELNVYTNISEVSTYMKVHGSYVFQDLREIFKHTDLLVVPSVWKETFGYTVLEALSHGVPVIVSENVGAKDLIQNEAMIVKAGDKTEIKDLIKNLSVEQLESMNQTICKETLIKDMKQFYFECMQLYKEENYEENNESIIKISRQG